MTPTSARSPRASKAYAGASRVRWVVAAPTRADAEALVANIADHLSLEDRPLISRVKAQSFAENPDVAARAPASRSAGWLPQIGQAQTGPACSWQVWVSDPGAPSSPSGVANVPLAPNDRLPVSPGATFRVGYTGLLQSKLYAFDETRPGAIRDLAIAPDVNIPVATGARRRDHSAGHGPAARALSGRHPQRALVERRTAEGSRQTICAARQSAGTRARHRGQYPACRAEHGGDQERGEWSPQLGSQAFAWRTRSPAT